MTKLHLSLFGDEQVVGRLNKIVGHTEDASPWFKMMHSWLEREIAKQFQSQGMYFQTAGRAWRELSPAYKAAKDAAGYADKPILERTGELRKSLTTRGGHAVRFTSPHLMVFGSTVASSDGVQYGAVHQNGTTDKRIPARKMLSLGNERDIKRQIVRSLGLFINRGDVKTPSSMRGV